MAFSNHLMQAMPTMELRDLQHQRLRYRLSLTLLSAKQTLTVQDTSSLRYAFRHGFVYPIDVVIMVLQYFDEPWKDAQFGGVEGWWGLFHSKYVDPIQFSAIY